MPALRARSPFRLGAFVQQDAAMAHHLRSQWDLDCAALGDLALGVIAGELCWMIWQLGLRGWNMVDCQSAP